MYLDIRQKKIVRKAIEDYDFIKSELDNKIKEDYNLEELSEFLVRFKGIEISELDDYGSEDDYESEYAYLDFLYNDINTCVVWEKDKGIRVSNTFEICDKEKHEYIVEDFLTKEEYQKMLDRTREENLEYLVATLKYYESRDLKDDYECYKNEVISFLKENW